MSTADTLPAESRLHAYAAPNDYLDTFSMPLEGRDDLAVADMRVLANHILTAEIGWVSALMSLRDRLVGLAGMKTTKKLSENQGAPDPAAKGPGDRIGFFRIYSVAENEIILGEDDWHQDFRISVFRSAGDTPKIFAATCCKRHNIAGHAYLALILPFHKRIVTSMLAKASSNLLPGHQPAR
ncbi:DUF2867 domain-containing protein [Roseibium sp. M-1]